MPRILVKELKYLEDETSLADMLFIGACNVSVDPDTSRDIWQIMKYNHLTGELSYASGDLLFNKKWDDRLSYTYK